MILYYFKLTLKIQPYSLLIILIEKVSIMKGILLKLDMTNYVQSGALENTIFEADASE